MEIKDNLFRHLSAKEANDDGLKNESDSLLKKKINNFLINYFSYLAWVLFFIIFAAGLFLFIYPQYKELIKSDEAAKQKLQAEYEAKARELKAIRALNSSYQSISEADKKKVSEMVPADGKNVWLIPKIESIILKNGAVLKSIKVEENLKTEASAEDRFGLEEKTTAPTGIFEKLPEGVGSVKLELSLSSVNYSVLKNLLKTFETNLQLFDIAKIDYNAGESSVDLVIYSYYLSR